MTQRWDVMTAREYATRDGEAKTAWTRIGTMFETKNGFAIALDALPLPAVKDGKIECRLVCLPPKERDEQPRADPGRRAPPRDINDEIPW